MELSRQAVRASLRAPLLQVAVPAAAVLVGLVLVAGPIVSSLTRSVAASDSGFVFTLAISSGTAEVVVGGLTLSGKVLHGSSSSTPATSRCGRSSPIPACTARRST